MHHFQVTPKPRGLTRFTLKGMPYFTLQSTLTAEERYQKRKLIFQDAVSLLSLLAITVFLFIATFFLFQSFSRQQTLLASRWLNRGNAALQSHHPEQAIQALRSALAYAPGQRSIEIQLAEALAEAGRTQEATAYFNTLWDEEPGNGIINLQLARLAAKQGSVDEALKYYRSSIYGTWEGDGTARRREVRLELITYLMSLHRYEQARGELLIAAGNAPDEIPIKLQIAGLMEAAGDPANAAQIYKAVLQKKPHDLPAIEGAGRTAYALGNYAEARDYLERALNHPEAEKEAAAQQQENRNLLADAVHILLLYPSPALSPLARSQRTLQDIRLARSRFNECVTSQPSGASQPEMAGLAARWQQVPQKLTPAMLQRNASLSSEMMQLVYDTELTADKSCGPAAGENALLSKIAQNPGAVEVE